MAKRLALFLAAILLIVVGATGAYFAFSIPRDIEAERLLKQARMQLQNGKPEEARATFQTVVQKYPRTDAAGAAITALFQINDRDRVALQQQLEQKLAKLENARQADRARLGNVEKLADEISKRPPPAPAKTPTKPATRRTTTRRRR